MKLITFWYPLELIPEAGARKLDLDKSKLIRAAIREKLAREGVDLNEVA
jgi:hypothetical protein